MEVLYLKLLWCFSSSIFLFAAYFFFWTTSQKKNNIIWNFLRFLIEFFLFCWLFFPGDFLCARIFKGFSSDRGIWFQEKSCKFLAFWAQTGTLRMRPIQKWVHLKCYCTQGVCHSNWGCAHSNSWHAHSKCWDGFFHQNFKLYNIFDHLLSCQNHHSKCMFSPHISVNHVKITLFIRYSNFFFYGGWPNVILTFSPSLYIYHPMTWGWDKKTINPTASGGVWILRVGQPRQSRDRPKKQNSQLIPRCLLISWGFSDLTMKIKEFSCTHTLSPVIYGSGKLP